MNKKPQISIIIPVYNVEKFLSTCLESVLNQTLKDIEIICIDDGSTDNSLKILEEYAKKDKRLVIIHQNNQGVSAARNLGLEIIRGEYFGFVDSDDWVDLDFFEKLYNTAKKYDADLACAGIIRKYPSSKERVKLNIKKEKIYTLTSEKYKIAEIPRKSYIYNKIYKTSEFEKTNLKFPSFWSFEDIYFSIRILYYLKKMVTVPNTNYYYRVNYKSLTRNMNTFLESDLLKARRDFIKFAYKHHISCDEKYLIKRKIFYSFFGVPIIKICEWETMKKYYLFGFILFFKKEIKITI